MYLQTICLLFIIIVDVGEKIVDAVAMSKLMGLERRHRLTASFRSISFRNIYQRKGSDEKPRRAL